MLDKVAARANILAAFRAYVTLGLPVIPLCAHDHAGYSEKHLETCKQAGKIPLIKGWREHETTTNEQVTSWIKEFKNINVGLPLGSNSGYVGIDIDGDLGYEMLDEMSGGDLPETWEFVTGAGRRLLYQIPVGLQTKKFNNRDKSQEHTECSILCEGQQTVLPPSVHHTTRLYEWVESRSPSDIDCAPAPGWLIDLIRLDKPRKAGNVVDLTKENPFDPSQGAGTAYVNPLIVSDTTLPSEFSEFQDLELDTVPPDTDYVGKDAKGQEKEEEDRISSEELMSKITAGGRDNQMTRIVGSFCARFRDLGKDYIMLMAKNHNLMFCDPPLDDFTIEAKVNHFWEREQMKTSQYKNTAGADGEKKKLFAPSTVAQVVINLLEDQGFCLKVDSEHPVIWATKKTEGPWAPIDTRGGAFFVHLHEAMSNPEHGGNPEWTTLRHYKDVANAVVVHLRRQARIWDTETKDVDTQTLTSFPYIPLAGGKLLDWRTGKLHPWDPETNLTYVLPVQYDPAATAPYWEQRLKEWLPDEGSRLIMQEFIGYSLIPYMGFEKALVMQGEGANGKSLFLETVQGLLGYKVVDSINMRNLFSRFGQAGLVGKILNVVNEAGSDYLRGSHADDFKNLVSGGRITADVKNQAPLTFNNTAKFIFASNHDIKTGDKSEGWARRVLIVPFDQDFRNSEVPKYQIMQELRSEYSGIFNWALEGLRRLMLAQQFSESESATRKKMAYIQDNDITADFFMNCLETFDLSSVHPDGKAVRMGTPTSVINMLFGNWIEFRESTVQKKIDHITRYLERKYALTKARTQHVLMVQKTMTECWIGLRVNIRSTAFLEYLVNEPVSKHPEVKAYAMKRLQEIDAAEGYDGGPSGGGSGQVTNIPTGSIAQ